MSTRLTTVCDGCNSEWNAGDPTPLRLLLERPNGGMSQRLFDFCDECKSKILGSAPILLKTYSDYLENSK